jgi:hypothetical protein
MEMERERGIDIDKYWKKQHICKEEPLRRREAYISGSCPKQISSEVWRHIGTNN